MSLLTSAPTLPTIERRTRQSLIKRFLRDTGLGVTGTATGGSTTTLVDTGRLKSAQYNSERWVGRFARIPFDAGGAAAAPELDIRPITTYVPSTGTITVDPAWSGAASVASGDTYELWDLQYPQLVLDTLDAVLAEECWLPSWTILTEVPDGDMEQNNITDWTASNATVTKATAEPAMVGARWLSVVSTSAGGYAESGTMRCRPGEQFHLSALTRANAAATTCKLIAWDKTNGVEISSKTTTRQDTVRVWFEFAAPATCYQVSVRLSCVENGVTTLWDEVCAYATGAREIRLPWWVKNSVQVKGIFRLDPSDVGTNLWDSGLVGEPDPNWDIHDDAFGGGPLKLVSRQKLGLSYPLFIKGTRNETAYANENTEIKHVDANWAITALAYHTFEQLSSLPNAGFLDMGWIEKARAHWQEKYDVQKRQQALRLEREQRSVGLDSYYYRDTQDYQNYVRVVS